MGAKGKQRNDQVRVNSQRRQFRDILTDLS